MAETLKEGRIRAALEQTERLGGVKEPLARMLVDKIERILSDGEPEQLPTCGCGRCDAERRASLPWAERLQMFMIVCPLCGNKRCPRAGWHGYACTHSNEPGQVPQLVAEGRLSDTGHSSSNCSSAQRRGGMLCLG